MTNPRRELPYDREAERKKPWQARAFMYGKQYAQDLPEAPRYLQCACGKLHRRDQPARHKNNHVPCAQRRAA